MNFELIENKRIGEKYYKLHHKSGLTIIVYPKEGFNSTYAQIGTNFGSINNHFITNGRKIKVPDGTAHYLEHKLFESEEGDAFTQYAKTGALANAYTSFEKTCYLFSCTEKFRESLEILLDLVQSPYFTPETVAKEQGIIGQEIKMYDDSPDWRVMMNLQQAMYHNNPINIDIAGTVETIAEITPEILYDCYNSYYNLNNMVMCIAGRVSPEEVLEIADRKLKDNARKVETNENTMISPCDGKLTVVPIKKGLALPVKQSIYSIQSLLRDKRLADRYEGGYALVYRLCVDNYHRYCYVESGKKSRNRFIPGVLHTVRPIALENRPVFIENCREYTCIKTERFGILTQMEVGAMLVGKISNHLAGKGPVKRGSEKGTFLYGGSTIIVLVEPDKLTVDDHILESSKMGREFPVLYGQRIGEVSHAL